MIPHGFASRNQKYVAYIKLYFSKPKAGLDPKALENKENLGDGMAVTPEKAWAWGPHV